MSAQIQFHRFASTAEASNPELAFLPNLFLLNPFNREFVRGKSKRIEVDPLTYYIPFLLFLITAVELFYLPTILTLIFAMLSVYAGQRAIQVQRCACRLSTCGRLFKGEVSQCVVAERDFGGVVKSYHIILFYRFQTPDGYAIDAGKTIYTILDSARWKYRAPKPRTPLAVLYVNDNLYEVL